MSPASFPRASLFRGMGDGPLRVVALVALVGVIGLPLVRLVGVAVGSGPGPLAEALGRPGVLSAIGNSLWTAALVASLATGLAVLGALATERASLPWRRALRAAILLPLLAPPFVTAFGWTRAYGPRGLLYQVAGVDLPGLYGPLGIVLVLTASAIPLAWLILAGALASRAEPDVERASRVSGAGPWRTVASVTLPLLRPAILSALVVTFVFGLNAFGVPAVLGTPAGFATMTTRLYEDLARSADPAAFAEATVMAVLLVIAAILVVGPTDAWLTGRPAIRTGEVAGVRGDTFTSGDGSHRRRRQAAALAILVVAALATVIPLIGVLLTALTRAVGLPPIPANWTFANFQEAIDPRLIDGLANSVLLSVVAASIVLPLGTLLAVLGRRSGGRVLRSAATLGFALPGSALAIAVLLAYGGWLRDTLAIILVAYVAKFWALGQRQMAGSLDRVPLDGLRAARASGAGPFDAMRSVVAPLLWPSLVAGWLVVFLFAIHELTMSSLLYGPGTATLAVVVLNAQQLGDPTVSAALAVLLVGLVALVGIPVALLDRWRRS